MPRFGFAKLFIGTILSIFAACSEKVDEITASLGDASAYVALAYPAASIDVDGRIDDWPEGITQYPISALLENTIDKSDDLEARFQVAYSPETGSIFLAVIVTDEAHITNALLNALSDDQDHLLMYLDKQHSPRGSGVNVFSFNEHHSDVDEATTSWDPAVRQPDWEGIRTAMGRDGKETIYEIELSLDAPASAGEAIGLDFMVYDFDGPDQNSGTTRVSWRDTDGKTNFPFKLGHVLLVDKGTELGRLEGRLVWEGVSLGEPINVVRISSTENEKFWIRHEVDESGVYAVNLPQARYQVTPEWGIYNGGDIQHKILKRSILAEVFSGQTVTAPELQVGVVPPLDMLPEQGVLTQGSEDKYNQIDDFISAYMEHFQIPGVSLAIIEGGELTYHNTYGVSNTYSGEPVNSETIFEAASITKPVFAFAVMKLAERGVIDLDKPLHEYLAFDEIAHDERYKLITARHVLSHQTGFPNWRSSEGMTIDFTPGTEFGYSGEGFEYLGRVVEHITGRDLVDILDEDVVQPLGLENIYFQKNDELFDLVAHGHDDFLPHKVSLPNDAGMAWSMHTEARSFSAFATALLEKRGLQSQTYDDMLFRHTVTDKYENTGLEGWTSFFGLGFQIEQTPFGTAIGHGGNNGDFKCEFKLYTDLGMGFVVFTNGNTGNQLTDNALEQFLITGIK